MHEAMGHEAMESAGKQGAKESRAAMKAGALRTFHVPGLEADEGRVVFKVDGNAVYAVDVKGGTATLTTAAEGPARLVANFDSQETLEGIIEGRLHPIVT